MSTTVFVYPTQLEFEDVGDIQTIKIFNPYDFTIYFHFQSTRPNAFYISNVAGPILCQHSIDIVITLVDKSLIEEKFQIKIFQTSPKGPRIGEKIVRCCLKDRNIDDDLRYRGSSSSSSSKDEFQDLTPNPSAKPNVPKPYKSTTLTTSTATEHLPNEIFIYFALIVCVFFLFLPHERNSGWPDWCYVSVNLKLVSAYILGMVTVFIIRK